MSQRPGDDAGQHLGGTCSLSNRDWIRIFDTNTHDTLSYFGLLLIYMVSSLTPDFLLPRSLTIPLWKRLFLGIRDRFAPKPPPLQLTSRPVDIGMLLGDRIGMPWYRSVFTNLGDVISPEALPPLELESQPEDVGELIGDQLSHPWWKSLVRNLADGIAPERQPALALTSKPTQPAMTSDYLLVPQWSDLLDVPKLFYPDKPKDVHPFPAFNLAPAPAIAQPQTVNPVRRQEIELLTRQKKRQIKFARLREAVWVSCVVTEIGFLIFYFSR